MIGKVSVRSFHLVECAGCDAIVGHEAGGRPHADAIAERLGWERWGEGLGAQWLCPACAGAVYMAAETDGGGKRQLRRSPEERPADGRSVAAIALG